MQQAAIGLKDPLKDAPIHVRPIRKIPGRGPRKLRSFPVRPEASRRRMRTKAILSKSIRSVSTILLRPTQAMKYLVLALPDLAHERNLSPDAINKRLPRSHGISNILFLYPDAFFRHRNHKSNRLLRSQYKSYRWTCRKYTA